MPTLTAARLGASQKPSEAVELSIVLPCLNEAETLATCIQSARSALAELGVEGEIIVADNGSSDGSQQIALQHGARVMHVEAKGYGAALMGGIKAAQGRFIVMADADNSYDLSHSARFLEALRQGSDLVIGNRFKGGIQHSAMPWLHRYLGNPVLSFIGRLFFHADCGDFHCGMRGFSKDAYRKMDLRCTGMEFASEMIVKATLHGLKVGEVPTTLAPDGRSRAPHLRTWRDGWRHLRFLLLYSPRWLFYYPGLFMLALGLMATAWLLPGPRSLGRITLDIHTIMYALGAAILGYQAIAFAVFTKIYGIAEGLLPRDPLFERFSSRATLERGLLIGIFMIFAGLMLTAIAVADWKFVHFGRLDPSQETRLVAPAVMLLILGSQTVLSSFFLGILGMKHK